MDLQRMVQQNHATGNERSIQRRAPQPPQSRFPSLCKQPFVCVSRRSASLMELSMTYCANCKQVRIDFLEIPVIIGKSI